jgi:radical SAM superfamily enzyme YgiQ (UPF0313 family)
MVVRAWLSGQPVTLSLKPGTLTVALDRQTVLVSDREGRLWSLYVEGHHFRRGLNGRVLAKWMQGGERQRRWLSRSEADLVVRCAALAARKLRDQLVLDATPKVAGELEEILSRAAAFDVQAARADVMHYHQVYKPIGILPPDQYLALVLQVTEGCSFNTCTFCSFYKERPFRIKTPQELREHIGAVRTYLGESIRLRRGIFMADANALVVPQRQLLPLFEVITDTLSGGRAIYGFVDGFSGRKKSARDYADLAAQGLRRVYIGLESGHDALLEWLRKPSRAADVVSAVRQIKTGGVNVGVIVLLGVGGERYDAGHVQDTIGVLNRMALGAGDLLYFSNFISAGTPYEKKTTDADLRPLPVPRMEAQREAILAGLDWGSQGPRIATYDIREFIY